MNTLLERHSGEIRSEHIRSIMKDIQCTRKPYIHSNGLNVGLQPPIITLTHELFPEIIITIGHLKTELENYKLAETLFQMAIEEYIK